VKREPSIVLAFIPLVVLVFAAAMSIFVWKAGMFMPLVIGIVAAAIIGIICGYKWDELQNFMADGVSKALPAVFILIIIGTIVGTWILSGVIPSLIYYGLAVMSPSIFIPTVALATGIVAVTLGSSFTSIATIGLAFMAIGQSMGFPPALIAGAVISGAFFGDKLSPLSDTTNVAPAMVDTDLFSHVKHMLWDTIPAFVISIVLFWLVGLSYSSNLAGAEKVNEIMSGLNSVFTIHPLLLLMPILTILMMAKKLPAIPTLMVVSVLGGLLAMIVQGNSLTEVIASMTSGFKADTGIGAVDSLLSRGGITSMLGTVGLVTVATALGGILDGTKVFEKIINMFIGKIKSTGSLILSTVASTLVVGFASGAQFLAIILPARAFSNAYKERGLDTKNLSRSVEAAGTVGINLVPWGVPAVFASSMLGVEALAFIPFLFFSYLVILINVLYGYMGISIAKKDYPETKQQVVNHFESEAIQKSV
jgi:Na+:H+ antiporter, NhaC family